MYEHLASIPCPDRDRTALTLPSSGNFVALQLWVCIESNTIITTGSFPCLFPLLKLFWKRTSSTLRSSSKSHHSALPSSPSDPSDPSNPSSKSASSARSRSSRKPGYFADSLLKSNGTFMGMGSRNGRGDDEDRERDSELELSILKVQDYTVSVQEDRDRDSNGQGGDEEKGVVAGRDGRSGDVER